MSRQLPNPASPANLLLAVLGMILVGLLAPTAAAQPTKRVAKESENATLEKTVLTTTRGRTLYSLSAETRGRFVCTGSCLTIWRPLTVPEGVKPKGPVKLSTIERPDGRTQVTFRGRPLYSFSGDSKAGDVNGEGIKDVDTWRAAVTGSFTPAPAPEPQPQPAPPNPYPSPYPY